jgi:hypothetical protein
MKVLGRRPAVAVVAVLAMMNMAASRVIPLREILEYTSTRTRTASLLDRPSADSAVKLIIEMDAERQQEQSRRLFDPYPYTYPYPRLLFSYPSYIPHVVKWRRIRASPPFWGVYSIHGYVNPPGIRYFDWDRTLARVPGILDPREISDIGWDRALSRVPGVVVR